MWKLVLGLGAIVGGVVYISSSQEKGFDVATVTCDNPSLVRQAKGLIADSSSPLLGKVKILEANHFRENSYYQTAAPDYRHIGSMSQKQISEEMFADRKHQCRADLMTDRGEMNMYYGWKVVSGQPYIEAQAMPVFD